MKKFIIWFSVIIVLIIAFFVIYIFYFIGYTKEISQGNFISEYPMENKALLVIDVQESTTGTEGTGTYQIDSEEYLRQLNKIIRSADSMGITVIYIRNEITDPVINLLDDRHASGSIGSLLDKRLLVVSDYILTKDRGDAFSNPKLDSLMIEKQISRLFITGLDAAYCVNRTIEAALNRGYKIEIIQPGVLSENSETLELMLTSFKNKGIVISKSISK